MEEFLKSCLSAVVAAAARLLFSFAGAITAPSHAEAVATLAANVGQLLTIRVEVSGHPARFLLDTGAGVTSVGPTLANEIGCAPAGRIVGFRMDGEHVEFQRCPPAELGIAGATRRREIGVFDINALLPEGLLHLDGILGLDAFRGERVTVLAGLRGLCIERSSGRSPRGAREGAMRVGSESGGAGLSIFVTASTTGPDLWLLFDGANLAGVRLHATGWAALAGEAGGQEAGCALSILGAQSILVFPSTSDSLIYHGPLSAAFIADYGITMDLGKERTWWRRAPYSSP